MTKTTHLSLLEHIMKEVQTLTLEQQQEVLDFILFQNSRLHISPMQFSEDEQESKIRTAFNEVVKKETK